MVGLALIFFKGSGRGGGKGRNFSCLSFLSLGLKITRRDDLDVEDSSQTDRKIERYLYI